VVTEAPKACLRCGKPIRQFVTGRPARYCSSRCRSRAFEAARRPDGNADVLDTTTANETPSRGLYRRGFVGDGDPCPQDPSHGPMYMVANGQRQWCPSSLHQGGLFYARDGVTPSASRAADDLVSSPGGGVKQGRRQPEAPDPGTAGASIPTGSIPARSTRAGAQLALPIAPAT